MAQQEPEAKRARTTPPGEDSASSSAAGAGAGGGGGGGGGSGSPAPAPAGQGFCLQQSAEWPLLSRASPFPNEAGSLGFTAFSPGEGAVAALDKPVLVVGAGGLGCEVLKNLALSGVRNIHVVDMDVRGLGRVEGGWRQRALPCSGALPFSLSRPAHTTFCVPACPLLAPAPPAQTIDLTNLNRQFLFRMKDVGAPKASTAAAFVSARVQGVRVRPWTCSVQEMVKEIGDAELRKFGAVVGCLDSLEVRRWLNAKLCALAPVDAEGALTDLPVPYVDGGSEAFKGHVKVILPKFTACLECGIANFTAPVAVPMCTLVSKPRKPEHCVAYVMEVEWARAFPARAFDTDSREDMEWINAQALARAEHFGIPGVNYTFTLGAVKNIIPAIAATNAVVSAGALRCAAPRALALGTQPAPSPPPPSSPPTTHTHTATRPPPGCVAEVLKLLTGYSQTVENEFVLNAEEGNSVSTGYIARLAGCLACGHSPSARVTLASRARATLQDLCDAVAAELQLTTPSLGVPGRVPWTRPESLDANLGRPLAALMEDYAGPLALVHPIFGAAAGKTLVVEFEGP